MSILMPPGIELVIILRRVLTKWAKKHPVAWLCITGAVTLVLIGISVFYLTAFAKPFLRDLRAFVANSAVNRLLASSIVATVAFALASFRYLDRGGNAQAVNRNVRQERDAMRRILQELNSKGRTSPLGYDELRLRLLADEEFLLQFAENQELQKGLTEGVSRALDAKGLDDLKRSTTLAAIDQVFEGADSRLREEIQSLNRRGTFNLVIGGVTTTGALAVLLLLFFYHPGSGSPDLRGALIYFIPRLSTTIFIEVFAFFFLRLYKSSLEEIKSYQVQLTDLVKQRVAVLTMISMPNDETKLAVLSSLCKRDEPTVKSVSTQIVTSENVKQTLDILQQILKTGVKPKD